MNKNIKFFEDSILIDDEILVIADLHIGEGLGYTGKIQIKEIIEKLNEIFQDIKERKITIKKIILLGDIKHDFYKISDSDWRETIEFLDYLLKKVSNENLIFLKGNHDNMLLPILKKRDIKLYDYYLENEYLFIHGDQMFLEKVKKFKMIFIGHLHPSIILADKYKSEKFKCFLNGKYKKKEVFILPSFNPASFGHCLNQDIEKIKKNEKWSFVIENKELEKFSVLIYNAIDHKIHDFGRLKDLKI